MKTRLALLSLIVLGSALVSGQVVAGESSRPAAVARKAPPVPRPATLCPFVPRPYNTCRPTPIDVYRYGSPTGVKSACLYGYSSDRDDLFFRQYPTSRGR